MDCTLRTTQGIRRSKNARNTEDNRHQGTFGMELLLTICFNN